MSGGKSVSKLTHAYDTVYMHSDMVTNAQTYAFGGID